MKAWYALAMAALVLLGGGCSSSSSDLETEYGSRQPLRGGNSSVNGTAVLAEMYEAQGNTVTSARRLSPRVEQASTIVWLIDDSEPPGQAAIDWFDNWLYTPGHTLVVIPRDFDAAPHYWRKMQGQAPAAQQKEIQNRLADANTDFLSQRVMLPPGLSDWEWFEYDSTSKPRKVTTLAGEREWTRGVDPSKLEIELYGRLVPDPIVDDVLLRSGPDALVMARAVNSGRVIVVANGSFLLNLPLVNKEHRKLAGALINESTSGTGDQVVFLEAGGEVAVSDSDDAEGLPSAWRYLNTPPLSYLLRSIVFFSMVMIFAMWPIFGVPREESRRHLMDFGRHIEALGKLLARTRNARYAWSRLSLYRQLTGEGTRRTAEVAAEQPPTGAAENSAAANSAEAATTNSSGWEPPGDATTPPANDATAPPPNDGPDPPAP